MTLYVCVCVWMYLCECVDVHVCVRVRVCVCVCHFRRRTLFLHPTPVDQPHDACRRRVRPKSARVVVVVVLATHVDALFARPYGEQAVTTIKSICRETVRRRRRRRRRSRRRRRHRRSA